MLTDIGRFAWDDPSEDTMNTHPLQALHCLRRHSTITLLLLLSCVAACAKSVPEITSVDGPKGQPMQRFKVLTFNTLHGLESIGGGVPSPNMEKLAAQGLDYNGRQVDQGKMKATVFVRFGADDPRL